MRSHRLALLAAAAVLTTGCQVGIVTDMVIGTSPDDDQTRLSLSVSGDAADVLTEADRVGHVTDTLARATSSTDVTLERSDRSLTWTVEPLTSDAIDAIAPYTGIGSISTRETDGHMVTSVGFVAPTGLSDVYAEAAGDDEALALTAGALTDITVRVRYAGELLDIVADDRFTTRSVGQQATITIAASDLDQPARIEVSGTRQTPRTLWPLALAAVLSGLLLVGVTASRRRSVPRR